MRTRFTALSVLFGMQLLGSTIATGTPAGGEPTCSDVLGIEVHGQHVIADYITGSGQNLDWPPAGLVGQAVAGEGAQVPGGPGPGFHFPNDVAPGASFCNPQSRSPGDHVPGDDHDME